MDTATLNQQRLARYRTAMANGRPDRIPIRPFVAEITPEVAAMTNQEVTLDHEQAFEAARTWAPGLPATIGNQMAWLKGCMALMQHFTAFGGAIERLRTECAMPAAICGIAS